MKEKVNWLDRRVAHPGPYLCLVLSEAEHAQAMKQCKVTHFSPWVRPNADATTHTIANAAGELVCVVALSPRGTPSGIEIAGLLVHEAVHVWQEYCARIGERATGAEQEAYAVQGIAHELMAEYARRLEIA